MQKRNNYFCFSIRRRKRWLKMLKITRNILILSALLGLTWGLGFLPAALSGYVENNKIILNLFIIKIWSPFIMVTFCSITWNDRRWMAYTFYRYAMTKIVSFFYFQSLRIGLLKVFKLLHSWYLSYSMEVWEFTSFCTASCSTKR